MQLFEGVDSDVASSLLAAARRLRCRRGDPIDVPPQGLLIIATGAAKVFSVAHDGVAQVMLHLLLSGDLFWCEGEQVEALQDCDVRVIGAEELRAALERSHRLALNALHFARAQEARAQALIRSFAFESIEDRLAALLRALAQSGKRFADGTRIELPLTQDALADMLGVGRRSVTRAFQRWARQGLLKKRDGRFIVTQLPVMS